MVRAVLSRLPAWLLLAGLLAWLPPTGSAVAGESSIQERLAAASPERGQALFRGCRACHGIDEGAAQTLGPNLREIVGRPVASAEGYGHYSPAMASFGGTWSVERLDRYLHQPAAEVEGTSMVFPGIADSGERADIIAWLSVISGSRSTPSGSRTEASAEAVPVHETGEADFGLLVAAAGADATHAYCTVCHSERIVAQQGLTREDWLETLEYMVDEHGMAPIEGSDFDLVIDYLSTHYGPDRPNFPLQ